MQKIYAKHYFLRLLLIYYEDRYHDTVQDNELNEVNIISSYLLQSNVNLLQFTT